MTISHFGRQAVGLGLAVAFLLDGCSGAGSVAPGRSSTVAGALPEKARGSDLIYAAGPSKTYILSYPSGSLVNSFAATQPPSICSDKMGDVFLPERDKIVEYAHGGTKPIATLQNNGYWAVGCASDPSTGNLAVTNVSSLSDGPGNVAIFSGASGNPQFYSDPGVTSYIFCSYDGQGNLFVTGAPSGESPLLAELPYGSSVFAEISIDRPVRSFGQIQWDGQYLALAADAARTLYRLSVSGSTATVVQTVKLLKLTKPAFTFFATSDTILTAAGAYERKLGFWKYPKGGRPVKLVGPLYQTGKGGITGITLSVANSTR